MKAIAQYFCGNVLVFSLLFSCVISSSTAPQTIEEQSRKVQALIDQNLQPIDDHEYTITQIVVQGNKHVTADFVLQAMPYKKGDLFDASHSSIAINNLYATGHFRQVQIDAEITGDKELIVYVMVEEKKLLEAIEITGNKSVKSKKIKEKLSLDKLTTIDEETLHTIALNIKKLYAEENRHFVDVEAKMEIDQSNTDRATAYFSINEGTSSKILRVEFEGNKTIPDRKLRSFIFTRENWLLSFSDGSGTLNHDQLEADKHRIEYFYRDHGYLMAKVPKAEVIFSQNNKDVKIIFHIQEGDLFTVRSVTTSGDDQVKTSEKEKYIVLEEGCPFSQSNLMASINHLKDAWGEKGYIYADVYPQVKPDEEQKEVDVVFHIERGNKLYANRVLITGNHVTRDKVIRRQLTIDEGDLITTKKLQESKIGVEYLSFFDREGVNWKLHRISDELADLEMNVIETKTGNFNLQFTYGSDRYSPKPSLKGQLTLEKRNLCGKGWDIGGIVQANRHRLQKIEGHFFDPHIFDSDVSLGAFAYSRWLEYEQWKSFSRTPIQVTTGGNVKFGFVLPSIDRRLQLILDIGVEDISNKNINIDGAIADNFFAPIVKRIFQEGTLAWIGLDLVKDTRNHQIYPNQGYRASLCTKAAFPGLNDKFGFFKVEAEGSLYNALIGVESLVLVLHLKLCHISRLGDATHVIPYKELFHMGGQATVRGHVWGGIGPAWETGDPLGAQNAVQFNSELVFPLLPDYSMKAHFFYDAGAGWDTPKNDIPDTRRIVRDSFDLRHSVGFGLNLLKPVPAKVDWGFKLDRRKRDGESPHELHLNMNYAW